MVPHRFLKGGYVGRKKTNSFCVVCGTVVESCRGGGKKMCATHYQAARRLGGMSPDELILHFARKEAERDAHRAALAAEQAERDAHRAAKAAKRAQQDAERAARPHGNALPPHIRELHAWGTVRRKVMRDSTKKKLARAPEVLRKQVLSLEKRAVDHPFQLHDEVKTKKRCLYGSAFIPRPTPRGAKSLPCPRCGGPPVYSFCVCIGPISPKDVSVPVIVTEVLDETVHYIGRLDPVRRGSSWGRPVPKC